MPGMISITSARSSSAMRGDSSISTVTSTTRWCRHVIVLDELRQRQRHALRRGGQKHGGARQPRMAFADGGLDQVLLGLAQLAARPLDQLDAAAPGQHQERDDGRRAAAETSRPRTAWSNWRRRRCSR